MAVTVSVGEQDYLVQPSSRAVKCSYAVRASSRPSSWETVKLEFAGADRGGPQAGMRPWGSMTNFSDTPVSKVA